MGICYSSSRGGRNTEQEEVDGWWRRNNKNSKKASLEAKFKRTCSGDFSAFIGKFGGGGGNAGGGRAAADELLQIPGRLFGNSSTSIASLYTQQGKKGINQDAMIVWENFSSRSDTVFCGVFDGHGPYGHMVARKVRDSLPVLLYSQWKPNSDSNKSENANATRITDVEESMDDGCWESMEAYENEKLPEMYLPLRQSMLKAFKLMDKELKFNSMIDSFCSGTTAVTLVKQGQDLILGNVGDSRAVLASRDKDNALTAVQLTTDLKPNLPREAARIQQCKGRVFALQDEPEVARVWLPNSDSPGLAMARAFGDFCLKDFGLISVPDVYYRHLTEKDEFIVLATDGVWDVLSNKEVVDVVASAPSRAVASRALVDCATRAWRLKYPTSKNDDCAVVCLFLDHVPAENDAGKDTEAVKGNTLMNGDIKSVDNDGGVSGLEASVYENLGIFKGTDEIVPVVEPEEEKLPHNKHLGQSKRSLAECLSSAENDDWSALDGIVRVNSLLSLPRFLSRDKNTASRRKWL
ncbi:Phosphoprotein phosphatase [Bertholletia excelsa]